MQTVSENWKNAHKQTLLSESYVEVSLDIADPDALADVSSQDNGAVYISGTSQVVSEVDKNVSPYCTLEQNLWVLNGERKAIPVSDYGGSGYVGDILSNEVCVFAEKMPLITLNFSKVFDRFIPGITITWSPTYGEFADSFVIMAYNGDTLIAHKEVTGNRSVKTLVMMDIVDYDRITIMITKWCLPYHRARVEEIFVGMNKVYSKTELFDYSHSQSVNPVSTSLPKTEIKFSIGNVDGEYNPYNEQGMAKYLMARQEVKARYGMKLNDGSVEWIKGGTFYLSEWYAKQNGLTAEFTARDLLEFMSATYEENHDLSSRTLYDLAELVLSAADLPLNDDGTVKWIIDDSLKSITTTAPLPKDTLANCLQVIANAAECVLYQDRTGTLRIEPLKFDDTDYKIDLFNSYSKSEITVAKSIKQVTVKVHHYTIGDKGAESTTTDVAVATGAIGETIVVDNPLIVEDDRASAIGAWVGTHLGHRMTLDSSWRVDVRLDALDIVTNENSYNTNKVRMTDVEFKFNGAFRGTGEGKVI
jgi:hypothetical protein